MQFKMSDMPSLSPNFTILIFMCITDNIYIGVYLCSRSHVCAQVYNWLLIPRQFPYNIIWNKIVFNWKVMQLCNLCCRQLMQSLEVFVLSRHIFWGIEYIIMHGNSHGGVFPCFSLLDTFSQSKTHRKLRHNISGLFP